MIDVSVTTTSVLIESTRLRAVAVSTSVTSANQCEERRGVSSGTVGDRAAVCDGATAPPVASCRHVGQHLRSADLEDPAFAASGSRTPSRYRMTSASAIGWVRVVAQFGTTMAGRCATSCRVISQEMPP